MAKISQVARGRRNIKISQTESAVVFTPEGVHNVLSIESRQFIDDMLTKGEEVAFAGITPDKFWTVVLPAVTYVKMAQYVKEVQQENAPPEPEAQPDIQVEVEAQEEQEAESSEVEADEPEVPEEPETPIEAFDD